MEGNGIMKNTESEGGFVVPPELAERLLSALEDGTTIIYGKSIDLAKLLRDSEHLSLEDVAKLRGVKLP